MRSLIVALAVCGLAGIANATITPIGVFTGTYSEGFENQPVGQFLPHYDVFYGPDGKWHGDIWKVGGGAQGLHVTSGWSFYYVTYPHSGSYFMGPTWDLGVKWEFETPAMMFGGWFTTNYQYSGATAIFYDENMNELGRMPIKCQAGNSAWGWDGWYMDPPAKYIEVWSDWGAGHVMHDDIQYTPVPEPASLSLLALALLLRRR